MERAARVLVVEDSEPILASVTAALTGVGHEVLARADGGRLESDLGEFVPDVVVLDVMLPGRDGYALLPAVRATSAAVILLTARSGVAERVRGLRAGADDYLVKPFALAELLARVEALLRRSGGVGDAATVADLVVDPDAGLVTRGGAEVPVTATELRLLHDLVAHRGRVRSKSQLLGAVWGWEEYDLNVVEVHVSALRRKLGEPRLIHTVRGQGYVVRDDGARDDGAGG
ncbi:winged helix-turn-helix domain-containing protein [Actinomycetospora corticicola]|uniref:DNA-binding response OmpR family regulator n=1 Tax=Actinomycetospora corticicola TaxID=663602 RepID=A0A7Y9J6I8_9PSEU|nr:DNA-binding response OmpR family regulator [Actinomycetospora corticicola]